MIQRRRRHDNNDDEDDTLEIICLSALISPFWSKL